MSLLEKTDLNLEEGFDLGLMRKPKILENHKKIWVSFREFRVI